MVKPNQKQIGRWILVVTLCLFGAGIAMAYFVYAKLETDYQELVDAYSTQRGKNKELTKKSGEQSKVLAKAQARVKSLEKEKKLSKRKMSRLEASGKKLAQDLRDLQPVYVSEQTKSRKLAQKAAELSKLVEEAQTQAKDMQESQAISEQVEAKLEAKVSKGETALQVLQRAYIDEQAKTKKLEQKSKRLSKAVEEAQAREEALRQASPPLKEMEQVRAEVKAIKESRQTSGQEKGDYTVEGKQLEAMLSKLATAYDAEQAKIDKFTQERGDMIGLIIRLRAEVVVLHYTLGVNYNKLGKRKKAVRAFQTALELDPDHADSHFELARVYDSLGERELAAAQFRQYVQLRPEAKDVERVKGWLMRVESELRAVKKRKAWPKSYSDGKSPY